MSDTILKKIDKILLDKNNITREEKDTDCDGEDASVKITLPIEEADQRRVKVTFYATDRATNDSREYTDRETVVRDTIAPKREMSITTPSQVVNPVTMAKVKGYDIKNENRNVNLYYDKNVTLTFDIDEANFYKEDVTVKINGSVATNVSWKNGEKDHHVGSVELSKDGEYVVEISYTDRSGNVMTSYKSEKIVVDKVKPEIEVEYDNTEYNKFGGVKYYDSEQSATITIKEANFNAYDVDAKIKGKDVNGDDIEITDYESYLATPYSWKKT